MNHTNFIATLLTARDDHQRHADALDRALTEANAGNIPTRVDGIWQMRSSDGRRVYHITADGCECTSGGFHKLCKHTAAVEVARMAEHAEEVDALSHAHVPATNEYWRDYLAMIPVDPFASEKQTQGATYADMGETPVDVCADCDGEPVFTTANSKTWPDLAGLSHEEFLQFLSKVRLGN